ARSAGPGRARSGAIDASRPGVHDLTLSTTVKKRVSIRPESTEEGKRAIGTVSWHHAEVTGRGERGGRLVVIRWSCPSAAGRAVLFLPEMRADPGHPRTRRAPRWRERGRGPRVPADPHRGRSDRLNAVGAADRRGGADPPEHLAAGRDGVSRDPVPRGPVKDLAQVLGVSVPGRERVQPEGGLDQLQRRCVLERAMMSHLAAGQVGDHDGRYPESELRVVRYQLAVG